MKPIPALLLLLCFTCCRKTKNDINPATVYQAADLIYGSNALQKMDVSLVPNRNDTTPFVILIHGGAWMAGDKSDLTQAVTYFTSQGINVANINYRLTDASAGSARAADLLADVGSALEKIRDQAAAWNTRTAGFVTFGFSAGAHLSLLYGYSYDKNNLVSAVVGLGSPTRFDDPDWGADPYLSVAESALPPLTGEPFRISDTGNALLKSLSPYYQPHFKPTFLIHGEKDQTVPPSQSENMKAILDQTGTAAVYVVLPNGGHSGEGASDADLAAAYGGSLAWVRQYSH